MDAGYQIQKQVDGNTIQQTTVDANGKETTKTVDGQLANTQSDQPLPQSLDAPVVKPGLPALTERVFTGEPAPDNAGSSAPTTTVGATDNNSPTGGGSSQNPPLRPVATVPKG